MGIDRAPTAPAPAEPTAPAQGSRGQAKLARVAFGLALVLSLATLFWPRGGGEAKEGGGFLVDVNGRPAPLADELSETTLVHFWASWCAPCVTEMPLLLDYATELRSSGVKVLLIAVADEPQDATRFLGRADLPLLFDPSWDVAHRFGTDKIPETYLLVRGQPVERFVGATDWSDPTVRALVARHLAG